MNTTVLMSGADFFDDVAAINPFMDSGVRVHRETAMAEHRLLKTYLEREGVCVTQVPAPPDCQDGVYTANWALVRGDKAILARLPNAREAEEPYAETVLHNLGKKVYRVPHGLKFSGQGDALACGNHLFMGCGYRTDRAAHDFVAKTLGYDVISLQTIPLTDAHGTPVINTASGWPDSYFYDLDLALAVLKAPTPTQRGLIAWCPEAFMPESRQKLYDLTAVDKIEVSLTEAREAFACNLVSTGHAVIMSAHAPQLRAAIAQHGLQTITIDLPELSKGGGFIRCTTLTLA